MHHAPLRFRVLAGFGLVAVLAVTATGAALLRPSAPSVTRFANAFLEELNDAERDKATEAYDDPKRVEWHFIPKPTRKGLPLNEMDAAQQTAALRLLRSALSEAGFDKTSKIMTLEAVIRTLEGPGSEERRDPEKYYFTIFGEPGDDAPWGLSVEGHHLSLNFVLEGDEVLDSTPQFFGTNPAEIKEEVEGAPLPKGTRVLRDEEVLAFELLDSLQDERRRQAIIAEEPLEEIRAAGEPQPPTDAPVGLAYEKMDGGQKGQLRKLVEVYAEAMPQEVAAQRLEKIDEAGWDKVHFAWAGADEPGVGHYYRIQGPTFVIELVNTQPDAAGNPANHIHCVWRDMDGDFNLPIERS